MVVMAQNFKERYPLVHGLGNFGSLDGDPAAAMRYTEAKLSSVGELMLQDIEKNTVDMQPNYDEAETEPTVLPSLFPNLLLNGTDGIAVGLACSFAPHNATDIYKALDLVIDNTLQGVETSDDSIIDIVKAPDFPTGGQIVNYAEVRSAYKTGRGTVRIRSTYHIETIKKHEAIVITEIPYQVLKSRLVEKIDEMRLNKVIEDIKEVRDETDRDGIRIVVELRDGAAVNAVIQKLLKHTPMQSTFSMNHNAICNGLVKENLTLKEMMEHFLVHATNVIYRRTQFDHNKATRRKHIVDGLVMVLDDVDKAIDIIRNSEDEPEAVANLGSAFGIDEEQGKAVCAIRLGTLSRMQKAKYTDEQEKLAAEIEGYALVLSDQNELLRKLQEDLRKIAGNFAKDERRTEIVADEFSNVDERELVKKEDIVITYSQNGVIKCVSADEYNVQGRSGKGQKAASLRDDDAIRDVLTLTTKDDLLFFTDLGYCHVLPAYKVPIVKKTQQGKYVANYLNLQENESIVAMVVVTEEHKDATILMVTRRGTVKRIDPSILSTRLSYTRVINLAEDDALATAMMLHDGQNIVLVTALGKGLRIDPFSEKAGIRPMGRNAAGVRGIRLADNDYVVDALPVTEGGQALTITSNGYAKRIRLDDINLKGRGSQGVWTARASEKTGGLVAAVPAQDDKDLFIVTQNAAIIRIPVNTIGVMGLSAAGVRAIRLNAGDMVTAVSVITKTEEAEEVTESEVA